MTELATTTLPASAPGTAGAGVTLEGARTLVLDQPGVVWRVLGGQATVYVARLQAGVPSGARRYVLTARTGDLILAARGGSGAEDYGFIVGTTSDARLECLPQLAWSLEFKAEVNGAEQPLARWIDELTRMVALQHPAERASNPSDAEELTLTAGQVFRAPRRALSWMRLQQGQMDFLGQPELRVSADNGVFPLGSEAWLRAEGDAQLALNGAIDNGDTQAVERGLMRFHELVFACIQRKDAGDEVQELARLQHRHDLDLASTGEALRDLASVLGKIEQPAQAGTDLLAALSQIGHQLELKFKPPGQSETAGRPSEALEGVCRASRVRFRSVLLRGHWWRTDAGPLLGYIGEGDQERPVALLRRQGGPYEIFDPRDNSRQRVTRAVAGTISPRAVMFYRGFRSGPLKLLDLPRFAFRPYLRDAILLLAISLGVTLIGMLVPQATRWIMDIAVPDANQSLLGQMALVLVAVTCGQAAFTLAQGFVMLRIQAGATASLQAATLDRLLGLPMQFFRKFASGDLLNRSMMVTEVSHTLSGTTLRSLLTGFLSLLNLGLLFYYSASLAFVAILIGFTSAAVTTGLAFAVRKRALVHEQLDGRLFGFVVQVLNGIAKLRVAGAERRAFNQWARRYAEYLRLTGAIRRLEDAGTLFLFAMPTVASILIYFLAMGMLAGALEGKPTLTMGTFLAFQTAFATFVAGITSIGHTLVELMDCAAKQKLMQPLLETAPESDENRADPGRLVGQVQLDKIVFRYQPTGPLILNGVSVTAQPGEFVALVGPSGSGKSTVFRLLLGFERPESGRVLFDGQNLEGLDLTAVRRQLGIVLQSARITVGSVFDNIACGTLLTLDEAWEAARDAGFADDLQKMPMGMHTMVAEGGGNLSGGQRQRLLIARALASHPKILLFDEATSALDNTTQATVTQSLQRRKVTRLVVAHRLSTIQDADRIYVIEQGRVVQSGGFAELAREEGLFKRLIARQMA
jgi:ATP-binding cassette subfamily C protein